MAVNRDQQCADLFSQLVRVVYFVLLGRHGRKIQQAVFPVIKGRGRNRFLHPRVAGEASLLFETTKVLAYGQCSGSKEDRLGL